MAPPSQKNNRPDKKAQLEQELERKLSSFATHEQEEKARALAKSRGLPFSDLLSIPIDPDALGLLDENTARQAGIAIVEQSGTSLVAAVSDPDDVRTKNVLEQLKTRGFSVSLILTTAAGLAHAYGRYASIKPTITFEVGAITLDEVQVDSLAAKIKNIADLTQTLSSVSATQLLEALIAGALATQTSDIHFEPEADGARLRYRLDGLLQDTGRLSAEQYVRVLNRMKVLSRLKLNVHKSPQDGRFTIRQGKTPIEVRTSVLPSEHGETVVLRLLDPRTIQADLEKLGMRADILAIVKEQLAKPTGAILTTGPTGSGKTTTLYAFVNHLNSPDTKIITIEDPIEYHILGISQTQVESSKEYTFAKGLRAIVRQDPDIILVGEIRDAETADIALNAALTGHLVFSTIHTNDAAGTIPRLIDLGIRPAVIAPAITLAMGQRLVRRLCPDCKKKSKPSPEELKIISQELAPLADRFSLPKLDEKLSMYEAAGCAACNNTGYRGRVGVYEVFLMTKEMERLVLAQPAISEVRDLAIQEGMITMLQDGYLKLVEGTTSVDEIKRVLG